MLKKVKVHDIAIFKNGEEHKILFVEKNDNYVCLRFDGLVPCQTTKGSTVGEYWAYKYNGEWDGNIEDRNDIVKVIHIEKDDVS